MMGVGAVRAGISRFNCKQGGGAISVGNSVIRNHLNNDMGCRSILSSAQDHLLSASNVFGRIDQNFLILFDRLSGIHPGLNTAFEKRDIVTFPGKALGNGLTY